MDPMEVGSPEHKQWLADHDRQARFEARTPAFVERRKGPRTMITAPTPYAVLDAIERSHRVDDLEGVEGAIFDASLRAGEMALATIGRSQDVWLSWHVLAVTLTVSASTIRRWARDQLLAGVR